MSLSRTFLLLAIVTISTTSLFSENASARTLRVDCDKGESLDRAVKRSDPGDTIIVKGTCRETVTVMTDKITISGQGRATVNAGGANKPAITVDGAVGVTLKKLVLRNGSDGIVAERQASVTLEKVTAEDNAGDGIAVFQSSNAELYDCVARNNGDEGLGVFGSSSVFVGVKKSLTKGLVSANNGDRGIQVAGTSNVLIDGAPVTSKGNTSHGFAVFHSSALLFFNSENSLTARNNGGRGITVANTSTLTAGNSAISAVGNASDGLGVFGASRASFSSASSVVSRNNQDGVAVSGSASIFLSDDSTLTIDDSSGDGLQVTGNSDADLGGDTTITDSSSQGALIFESSSLRLRGSTLIARNGSPGSEAAGLQVSRSSNASLRGDIKIRNNKANGLWVLQESHGFFEGGTLSVEGNGLDGIQVYRNSQLEILELTSPVNVLVRNNGGQGIFLRQRSSARLAAVVAIRGNTESGLHLRDGSEVVATDVNIGVNGGAGLDSDEGGVYIEDSTITGGPTGASSEPSVIAAFGSRLTMNGNTLSGPIVCDGTVLSRGDTVCPP